MLDQQLEASVETPMDFTAHLAERLQLAPEAVVLQLETWLLQYPRKALPAERPTVVDRASDLRLYATAG